jgi:hypothetical protein
VPIPVARLETYHIKWISIFEILTDAERLGGRSHAEHGNEMNGKKGLED